MAFKSPGIYFTEIDNTEYVNPTAEINTTVAIVGFAKKGPIGEPTEINSYSDFKTIFGTPISGTYAGLAVRSVLSAGGTVLFVRIADESLASKSNVILKNGTEKVEGALIVNNKNAITVGSSINGKIFTNGAIYASKIIDNLDKEKTILLRTSASGRYTVSEMIKQFTEQLKDSYGFTEYKFKSPVKTEYRVFKTKVVGTDKTTEFGPYFVELTNSASGKTVADVINNSINKGTNPYQIFGVNTSANFVLNATSGDLSTAYFSYTDSLEDSYKINIKKNDTDESVTIKVKLENSVEGKITLEELADSINTSLDNQNIGIKCKFIYDNSENNEVNSVSLLFFSTDYIDFEIKPFVSDGSYKKSLFTPYSNDINEEDKDNNFIFRAFNPVGIKNETALDISFEAEYNELTNGIIFKVKSGNVEGSKISISNFDFAVDRYKANFNYLFSTGTIADENSTNDIIVLANNDKASIGTFAASYTGEKGLSNIKVTRGDDQRIYITENGYTEPPTITDVNDEIFVSNIYTNSLNDLFGPQVSEEEFANSNFSNGKDSVLLKVEGRMAVKSENEDMIVFTAKEYGSGTTNIGVEVYTSVSPIDETTKTHYVSVYVDGVKKETWENVSYNPEDDNYFAKLINDEEDNGGSAYVTVTVKRGKTVTGEVKVPDTASLTNVGIVYLGTAIDDKSISYSSSTAENISEYKEYDYFVGNDGKPASDYTDLFTAAMNTETSGLSNKDLYSWHILITPDDGQNEEIQDSAIALCEFMEDAIYIADPPAGLSRDGVIKWHNGASQHRTTPLQSNYCCTYWPWLKVYNAIESKFQYVMPSVIMAAQFCKVDNNYEPWYAPAGATNGYCSTALDLEVNTTDKRYPNKTDRDALYLDQNRVNPFLKMRDGSILAYGEKTCQRKNSTLTKIHTRRMLIALKKDLNAALKGYIFQPTVGENITKIKSNVTAIMEEYKTGGGVSEYVVDTSMNTTETLQQDILYISIACVPTGCIEQVEITFTLNKSSE